MSYIKNKLIIVMVMLCAMCWYEANAQREISFGGALEQPFGEFKQVFRPSVGYMLSFSMVDKHRDKTILSEANFGFISYKPNADTLFIFIDETAYETVKYDDYLIFPISVSFQFEYLIDKIVSPYYGFGLGLYIVRLSYEYDGLYRDEDALAIETKPAILSKVGCKVHFTNTFGLFLESKYNFMLMLGPNDSQTHWFNHYLSHGLGLFKRF